MARKAGAMRRLDQAIQWMDVLGADRIGSVVNALKLPDNQSLWNAIEKRENDKGSALYSLGISGLFKEAFHD